MFTAIIVFPSVWERLTNFINGKLLVIICIILFFIACIISPTPNAIHSDNTTTGNNTIGTNVTQNSISENTTNVISSISTFENEIDVNITSNNKVDENRSKDQ